MKSTLAALLTLAVCSPTFAGDFVVVGRLVQNEPMTYVKDECPEDHICLHSWWKSVVDVQQTIQGASIPKRITAASMQHNSMNPSFKKSVRLFVLKYIDDPEQRAKLRAEYYLQSMSKPHEMFCLPQDPKDLGLDTNETYVGGSDDAKSYCFELPPR